MHLSAVIGLVWQAVLGLWASEETVEDEQTMPPPTSTSSFVVYSTATEPSYTMPTSLSLSSLFSILSIFAMSIMYLPKLFERLFVDSSLSYYQSLSWRQHEAIKWLTAQYKAHEHDKEQLESAAAQHLGDLQSLTRQHEAQLEIARQGHEAEIEKLKTEHSRDLQQWKETQERANKHHAAITASASKERSMVESSLREAIGNAKTKHRQLQTDNDYAIARLEEHLDVVRHRLYEAERELSQQKFIGQDEWDNLRAEKQKAASELYGASKERDIYLIQLRETCAKSVEQSKEVAASALTAGTATQRMNDMQVQLTQKDEKLAKTLKRNEVLEALVRKTQADVDERDQALSKAEKEGRRAMRELERLKKKQPRKQVTATVTRQDSIKEDGNTFDKLTSTLQELHDARDKADKLTAKLKYEEVRAIKATEDLTKAKGELKAANGELTATKNETLAASTELGRVKRDLENAQKTSVEAQNILTAARNELSVLKGADARVFLATDAASKAQKELTTARTELRDTQAALSTLNTELENTKAELLNLRAEQNGRETTFQKFQELGRGLELEVHNLRQINAGLVNIDTELGHTKVQLRNTQAQLGNTKAELEYTKAEILGLKAQQMGREAALQRCQENGRQVELQANNLQQTNAKLGQEVNELKVSLSAAQAEATSLRQNQQHGTIMSTAQADPASMPATVEYQDTHNAEDDAMGDEYELWEDVWPGIHRPEGPDTAKADQAMEEGETVAPSSHEEAPSSAVPGVSGGNRQLDDLDLDLLGENDSPEPETSIPPAISSAFTTAQFTFRAPQNIAWPPSNVIHTLQEFREARPEEQPTEDEDEDTARLIEEELANDLEIGEWSGAVPEAPIPGPELIYGDYLPATQQVPQPTLSSLLYGAEPQTHTQQMPQLASASIPSGQTHIATPPKFKIPGLFHDASAEAQTNTGSR